MKKQIITILILACAAAVQAQTIRYEYDAYGNCTRRYVDNTPPPLAKPQEEELAAELLAEEAEEAKEEKEWFNGETTIAASPVPMGSFLNVTITTPMPQLCYAELSNSLGVVLREQQGRLKNGSNLLSFQVEDLPPGVYFLTIKEFNYSIAILKD